MTKLGLDFKHSIVISQEVVSLYKNILSVKENEAFVHATISKEMEDFSRVISIGSKMLLENKITGKLLFDLEQSHGFYFELSEDLLSDWGKPINEETRNEYLNEKKRHQELSRSTSVGMFKGGLADHSDQVIKYHTATHLLHQALRDVLGDTVRQEGSNITGERLRFDFSFDRKPTDEEVKKVEVIINQKIQEGLPVEREIMKRQEAEKLGALSFFKEKYGEEVSVYSIAAYSKEFCGGPHVQNTSEIGNIQITKTEKIGANLLRVYAE